MQGHVDEPLIGAQDAEFRKRVSERVRFEGSVGLARKLDDLDTLPLKSFRNIGLVDCLPREDRVRCDGFALFWIWHRVDEEFRLAYGLLLPLRIWRCRHGSANDTKQKGFSDDDMLSRLADRPLLWCRLPLPLSRGHIVDGLQERRLGLIEPLEDLLALLGRKARINRHTRHK